MTRDFSFTTATQQVSSQSQRCFRSQTQWSVSAVRHSVHLNGQTQWSVSADKDCFSSQIQHSVSAVRHNTLFQQSTTLCFRGQTQRSVSAVRHSVCFKSQTQWSVSAKIWFQHSDIMFCFSSQTQHSVLAVRHNSVSAVRCNALVSTVSHNMS